MRQGLRLLALVAVCALAPASAARAATIDFSSSFEPSDAQPTWTNTAERASGVTGPKPTGIPGNVTDTVVAMQASGENTDGGEVKENLVDGSENTKWLVFESTGWVAAELAQPVAVITYALTSANDAPGRDPQDWTLEGSQDGQSWTVLDTQTGQSFDERFQTKEYSFSNTTAYRHYRLNITRNHGEDLVQLAELQLSKGGENPPPGPEMRSMVGGGPTTGYNAKSRVGWTGVRALQYGGEHTADGRAYSYNKVFDVNVKVTRDSELSYLIFPEFERDDLNYPSTYASVDLAFTDGTYLHDLHAIDQHGAGVSPQGQGRSKTLYTNQWNRKVSRIGDVAAGKTVDRILVAYDNPDGPASFGGWVDDIAIKGDPPQQKRSHPSDWALTTRGTNSSGAFSRGNNIPATAVPHGFNFWTPMTNAGSMSWLYEYQHANNAGNLPTIQAFEASHEPSPWMGDRQTFQVMPSTASTPDADRRTRALPFRHANEVARPHYYGVTFENGQRTEIAPTDHAALFRFTFPGATSSLIFDNVNRDGGLSIDQANGVVTGYSDVRSGLSNGATRLFVYATFDRPITASGTLDAGGRPAGYARFDARTVNMRIATSLISIDQARANLALELSPGDTLESVRSRAQKLWDDKLGVIDVDGATDDQRTTLYSNLYRLNLYPNSAFENTGSASRPRYRHAVQSSTDTPPSTPTETGAPVADGKVYVNNGFWDTYRTTWAAYSLFDSRTAGELVDGFVQQYRDGGWIARWSSPGYANLMTGTSSDVSFADAYVKGVQGFDGRDAYDAALKNATVEPDGDDPWDSNVGRKGLFRSLFLGYTPSRVSEGVSWALEGDINDYGIGNMAAALARRTHDRDERRRLEEESEYFLSRAQNYVNMFDPAVGFFQGRAADGTWKSAPPDYDPREWGHEHDYTETDGWGFAFHAPQDGQGLANLYGGRDGLAAKLDEFFATPETAKFVGSYGGTIHEMIEARDVRMGQWGFSNQVSHHIPYMYDYAGQPAKTQQKVREALRRLYLGSDIGQGYAGDEDNGETSAWYLFSALGFYPLQMGSPYYAIGSPLFDKATVHLGHGRDLVVRARNNSARNVYVQGLRLNGRSYDRSYLRHEDIAHGGTLEFVMGPRPSRWGASAPPPSLTRGDEAPRPLRDVTGSASTDVAELFDDDSSTSETVSEPVSVRFGAPQAVSFYTLTSVAPADAPRDWVLEGSTDGTHWQVLDERHHETFRWQTQTRPFKVDKPGAYQQYRLRTAGALAEIELLNREAVDLSPLVTQVAGVVAGPGETVDVPVTVSNYGAEPASGEATLTAPAGWTVDPDSAPFGPLDRGESATVTFHVTLPDAVAPGTYALNATAGGARGAGTVTVIGDAIEFEPETDAEAPWLFERDGSQFDGTGRYADGGNHYTYRFTLPADVTGGTFTLHMHAEFLVRASTDNEHWTTVLHEDRRITDGSNDDDYTLDLNAARGTSRTLFLRFEDSFPDDGWGAWLSHLRLELQR